MQRWKCEFDMVWIRRGRRLVIATNQLHKQEIVVNSPAETHDSVGTGEMFSKMVADGELFNQGLVSSIGKPLLHIEVPPPPFCISGSDIHSSEGTSETKDGATRDSGEAIKGRKVRKKFGRKHYMGEVTSFDPDTKWYWIHYEDGDQEEVDWTDLEKILLPLGYVPGKRSAKRFKVNPTQLQAM